MKVNHRVSKEKLKKSLPTLEEKVDALLEGGQVLTDLKQKIKGIKAKLDKNN